MIRLEPSRLLQTGYTLGQLAAAVDRSPLRSLWLSHETARVVARLYSRGAAPVSAEELLALGAGVQANVPSVEVGAARRFWGRALRLWRVRVSAEPLATILEITNQLAGFVREDMPPGDLALEAPMRVGAQTGWALPSAALALPPQDTPEWEDAFLVRLGDEAADSLERLRGLERDFARWLSLLPETRSDSRLREAVVLLGTVHALTPRYLTETLGLTRQAAARLLRKLEELGIIRQAVRRQRWIIYLAENAAPAGLVPETTSASQGEALRDLGDIDSVLERAYRAIDRSVRRDGAG